MTCPDCHASTKKHGPPTLSPSGFLDQMIFCLCGWCGVDSEMLTDEEVRAYQARPRQLRLL